MLLHMGNVFTWKFTTNSRSESLTASVKKKKKNLPTFDKVLTETGAVGDRSMTVITIQTSIMSGVVLHVHMFV